MTEPWSWRVDSAPDNAGLGLLYEPGNWGDVLKGEWALALAGALPPGPLQLLDPFAGAPHWPLQPGAAERLDVRPASRYSLAAAPHRPACQLPSTGRMLLDWARAAGRACTARVTDQDDGRRQRWAVEPDAELLPTSDGATALASGWHEANLVLVDPYDLFEREQSLLPLALRAAPNASVLFYLFNKAPRGAAAHKSYRALRQRLEQLRVAEGGRRQLMVGRIPSDPVLPRAFHEVLLLTPAQLTAALESPLREVTLELSRRVCDGGAFEAAPASA